LPRGADAVGPGNPGWSSCQKGRRVRTANRWAVGSATRRAAVRFKRPSGRRTRLSRARLGTAAGVPRGADDPQGPIGREQAGSPAGHPDGFLGVVLLKFGPSSRPRQDRPPTKADLPSSIRRTGPHRSPLVLVRADPRVRTVGSRLGSQWLPVARQVPVLYRSRSRTRSTLPA
jgi:hypothetical protein